MTLDIVVGTQWGDEGKGRVVDLLSAQSDVVARYNGGDNAGHTVNVKGETFKLHLIPSGIIHPHTIAVMGGGMVINPEVLLREIEMLTERGIDVSPARLQISRSAHLITPAHIAIDKAREEARGGGKIGTTQRGIGPAYNQKSSRDGIRMEALMDKSLFRQSFQNHINHANETLRHQYGEEPFETFPLAEKFLDYAETLAPYIKDASLTIHQFLKDHKRVLAEGAQGTLLDLDHGTYPFVTSSNPTAPGALVGLGVGFDHVNRVIGVAKAFQSRVGSGPFPTEQSGEVAGRLRGTGENPWDEFGTTTGRPRRVGWLDAVLLRYSARINGLTELVLTKLDILSGLETVKICTGYAVDGHGTLVDDIQLNNLPNYQPVYTTFDGWDEDLWDVREWKHLPENAKKYVRTIETLTELPIQMVSVGPERDQTIDVQH